MAQSSIIVSAVVESVVSSVEFCAERSESSLISTMIGNGVLSFTCLLCLLLSAFQYAAEADDEVTKIDEDVLLRNYLKWLQEREGGASLVEDLAIKLEVSRNPSSNSKSKTVMQLPRADIKIVSKSEIKSGQVILSIQKPSAISSNRLWEEGANPLTTSIQSKYYSQLATLAAWILREKSKGIESSWADFIAIQPSYVPLPSFFDGDMLQQFEEQDIASKAISQAEKVLDLFSNCKTDLIANATVEEFKWAIGLASSRSFVIPPFTGTNIDLALLPFAEFFNHGNQFQARLTVSENSIEFLAREDVKAGQEIHLNYDKRSSADLFLSHGFALEDDSSNSMTVSHDTAALTHMYIANYSISEFKRTDLDWAEYISEEAVKAVEEELKEAGGPLLTSFDPSVGFTIAYGGVIEPRLIAVLISLWHYDFYRKEPDFKEVAFWSITFGYNEKKVTCADLEEEDYAYKNGVPVALRIVYFLAMDGLQAYSTSVEEDQQILSILQKCSEEEVTDEEDFCKFISVTDFMSNRELLRYRVGKKKLLQSVIDRLLVSCPGSAPSSALPEVEEDYSHDEL